MTEINLDDFKKVQLVVAKIIEVEELQGADRLWKLKIDVGSEIKQIVAGIKKYYDKEKLLGKSIVVVNKLAPAVLRGVESRGMLLAAKHEQKLTLLTLDSELPPGSIIG